MLEFGEKQIGFSRYFVVFFACFFVVEDEFEGVVFVVVFFACFFAVACCVVDDEAEDDFFCG